MGVAERGFGYNGREHTTGAGTIKSERGRLCRGRGHLTGAGVLPVGLP